MSTSAEEAPQVQKDPVHAEKPTPGAEEDTKVKEADPVPDEPDIDQERKHGVASEDGSFNGVSDEILEKIFSFLTERDLERAAGSCTRFFRVANDVGIWKRLYHRVFEYSIPLYHSAHGEFEFREPQKWEVDNPWKESFKQLRHGVHVRPSSEGVQLYEGNRKPTHFSSLEKAIGAMKSREQEETLIFLHAGHYVGDALITIDSKIQIIGAAPQPNIAEKVIIERSMGYTTVAIAEGAMNSFLGCITVKCSSDHNATSVNAVPPPCPQFAVQVTGSSSVIEHCNMHSSSLDGAALLVEGESACPEVRHCTVSDSDRGIYITSKAEPNFDSCNIHSNVTSGIKVVNFGNPTVLRSQIHGQKQGVLLEFCGMGQFLENKIHHNTFAGILITLQSDPTIRYNEIYSNHIGVDIKHGGNGLIEYNDIHNCQVGVQIG